MLSISPYNQIKKNSRNKGFVILFAVLISATVLLIGAGIFSSAFKEAILASTATESQVALFVADTGMECALYAEFVQGTPPDECADNNVSVTIDNGNQSTVSPELLSYRFPFGLVGSPQCGDVSVIRNDIRNEINGTNIIARGYNACLDAATPDVTNPTLVERRLEVWYPNATPAVVDGGSGDSESGGGSTVVVESGGNAGGGRGSTNLDSNPGR